MEPTYENFSAECPHCGAWNILNRASDLQTFRLIDFRTVKCQRCDRSFNINGDCVNAAHEMLLSDCFAFIERKQYMQCVLSAAQAYEVFFSHFLRVQLIYRAYANDRSHELPYLNRLIKQLYDRVNKFAFADMRRLVLRLVVNGVAPASLAAAESAIEALPKLFREHPSVLRKDIEGMADERLRALLLRLMDADINKLRNRVVHKDAYRPKLEEAKRAHDEARDILFGLRVRLRLGRDVNWYISEAGP